MVFPFLFSHIFLGIFCGYFLTRIYSPRTICGCDHPYRYRVYYFFGPSILIPIPRSGSIPPPSPTAAPCRVVVPQPTVRKDSTPTRAMLCFFSKLIFVCISNSVMFGSRAYLGLSFGSPRGYEREGGGGSGGGGFYAIPQKLQEEVGCGTPNHPFPTPRGWGIRLPPPPRTTALLFCGSRKSYRRRQRVPTPSYPLETPPPPPILSFPVCVCVKPCGGGEQFLLIPPRGSSLSSPVVFVCASVMSLRRGILQEGLDWAHTEGQNQLWALVPRASWRSAVRRNRKCRGLRGRGHVPLFLGCVSFPSFPPDRDTHLHPELAGWVLILHFTTSKPNHFDKGGGGADSFFPQEAKVTLPPRTL